MVIYREFDGKGDITKEAVSNLRIFDIVYYVDKSKKKWKIIKTKIRAIIVTNLIQYRLRYRGWIAQDEELYINEEDAVKEVLDHNLMVNNVKIIDDTEW